MRARPRPVREPRGRCVERPSVSGVAGSRDVRGVGGGTRDEVSSRERFLSDDSTLDFPLSLELVFLGPPGCVRKAVVRS